MMIECLDRLSTVESTMVKCFEDDRVRILEEQMGKWVKMGEKRRKMSEKVEKKALLAPDCVRR